MINYGDVTKENIWENDPKWSIIGLLILLRMLIIGGLGSGKTNTLLSSDKTTKWWL